jgi:heme-based aerotactic transducer
MEQELINTISHNSTVDRLKFTLKKHLLGMFEGVINLDYIENRTTIAQVHFRIGLSPK